MANVDEQVLLFGDHFLEDHAGQLISDPRIALVELVANSYDAGATRVEITWPERAGEEFVIADNGTGMTPDQFERRWKTLNYNRTHEQGRDVEFPKGTRNNSKRTAFGQNGKGRHAAFCFDDKYFIETWRDGISLTILVEWTRGKESPFRFAIKKNENKKGHGTRIWGIVNRHLASIESLSETIGSKFLVDPSFEVIMNGRNLQLVSLTFYSTRQVSIDSLGKVTIHRIDAPTQDRTTKLRGITYWLNGRMVGQPSWDGLDERGAILDGRSQAAKRHSFIIEPDFLDPSDVRVDWTGFHDNQRTLAVRQAARQYVTEELDRILMDTRKERKIEALSSEREALKRLPPISQKTIGEFVDEVQKNCPLLTDAELSKTLQIFMKFEQARSGYEMLHKLAKYSPQDIDIWNKIMEDWTATNANLVLTELKRRLDLIVELQELVNDKKTDELHQLQPLFARGLWIFGPEYEAVEFTSNRQMVTVIRELLGGTDEVVSQERPDFVVLPDRSLGVYSADQYDKDGEVIGLRKVLIVELKRGGSTLSIEEVQQGQRYPSELKKGNAVLADTEFTVFVLGSKVGSDAEVTSTKTVRVIPVDYDSILRRAHARTFHLHRKLESVEPKPDKEVEKVLAEETIAQDELPFNNNVEGNGKTETVGASKS